MTYGGALELFLATILVARDHYGWEFLPKTLGVPIAAPRLRQTQNGIDWLRSNVAAVALARDRGFS